MTVATNASLEAVYSQLKKHEASLARVSHSGHHIERDIFGDLLSDSRNMAHEMEVVLDERQINPEQINIPANTGTVTPHSLIEERNKLRHAYGSAIAQYTTESSVRSTLEEHHSQLSGGGQEKLEILCAAILSDQ